MASNTFGTIVAFSSDVSPTAIGQVMEAAFSGLATTQIKISHLGLTDHWDEFINGFTDGGVLTLKILFAKAQYATLLGYVGHTAPYNLKVTLPDASTYAQRANLQTLGKAIPADDAITNDIGFKLTGKPTWTSGA